MSGLNGKRETHPREGTKEAGHALRRRLLTQNDPEPEPSIVVAQLVGCRDEKDHRRSTSGKVGLLEEIHSFEVSGEFEDEGGVEFSIEGIGGEAVLQVVE